MELNDYQIMAHETSHNTVMGNSLWLYPTLGLVGEAGELANKAKKVYRDNDGYFSPDERDAMLQELGDVLWYVAEIANQLGASLNTVAQMNLTKLRSRQQRGVIGGSGDNR